MDLIKANWDWIASNPWGFAALAALLFGAGWGFAKLLYSERIELLKAQIAASSESGTSKIPATKFLYRPNGRHGRNVLADTTHDVTAGDQLSFQADVPDGKKLHVVVHGPPPQSLSETFGAWYFSVIGVNNWTHSTYQENTSGPIQHFNAEDGRADMMFFFGRPGEVLIDVFEGDSKSPAWSKTIHVADKRGT